MEYVEKNKVNWVGIRPAYQGNQIGVFGRAVNQTTIVYTVPVDKVFSMFDMMVGMTADAGSNGWVALYNNLNVFDSYFMRWIRRANFDVTFPFTFYPPFEIIEGWSIRVYSSSPSFQTECHIHGILIDV